MPSTVQPIIATADIERQLRFYTALVGAKETDRYPEEGSVFFIELRVGDSSLGLVANAGVADAPAGRILLSIDVPDVNALLDHVEQLGGEIQGPPNDMPWGQRVAHIKDPDGNVVNLTQTL